MMMMMMTHRHDLFYITMKYHQNIPNSIQVIEGTRKCLRTDGCQAHRYIPCTFRLGIKMVLTCDDCPKSTMFLRNLCVQKSKSVRSLISLYVTIDHCDSGIRM